MKKLKKHKRGFNSLQTGNCIQTKPFWASRRGNPSFNSLQTGNCIQTSLEGIIVAKIKSFNSLQTGNCIQTHLVECFVLPRLKFQFPSNGKLHSNKSEVNARLANASFQFPSNGKLHSNSPLRPSGGLWGSLVSIPFKRETAFKLVVTLVTLLLSLCFNSLQTGNCIQTSFTASVPMSQSYRVSISFKRETAFKLGEFKRRKTYEIKFQFPSNGKLHSNLGNLKGERPMK